MTQARDTKGESVPLSELVRQIRENPPGDDELEPTPEQPKPTFEERRHQYLTRHLRRLGYKTEDFPTILQGFNGWLKRYDWDREMLTFWRERIPALTPKDRTITITGPNGLGKTVFTGMFCVELVDRLGWHLDHAHRERDYACRQRLLDVKDRQRLRSSSEMTTTENDWATAIENLRGKQVFSGGAYRVKPSPLIIDEGFESASKFGFVFWRDIFDQLYRFEDRLIILVTNKTLDEIEELERSLTGSVALVDRLYDGQVMNFTGESFRRWRHRQQQKGSK